MKLLFGRPYEWAIVIVGAVMMAYVLFGGMLATTWVQIVKAVLLLGGAFLLAIMVVLRFCTVPSAKTALPLVSYATAFIGFFYLLTFILGFGAMVIVGPDAIKAVDKGGNMAAPLLAEAGGGGSGRASW